MPTNSVKALKATHMHNHDWKVKGDHTWAGCGFPSLSSFLPSCSHHYLPTAAAPTLFLHPFPSPYSEVFHVGLGRARPLKPERLSIYTLSPTTKWQSQTLEGTKYTWSLGFPTLEGMHTTDPTRCFCLCSPPFHLHCQTEVTPFSETSQSWRLTPGTINQKCLTNSWRYVQATFVFSYV